MSTCLNWYIETNSLQPGINIISQPNILVKIIAITSPYHMSQFIDNHSKISSSRFISSSSHEDNKHFPHYWPFVRGIHQSAVDCPYKGPVTQVLVPSSMLALTNCWRNSQVASAFRCHVIVQVIALANELSMGSAHLNEMIKHWTSSLSKGCQVICRPCCTMNCFGEV